MQSIDILRIGTISFSGARSAPGERSGDRSACHASSQKQTTVKIRCIAVPPSVEADSESGKCPADGFLMPTLPRRLLASLGCLSSDHARLNRRDGDRRDSPGPILGGRKGIGSLAGFGEVERYSDGGDLAFEARTKKPSPRSPERGPFPVGARFIRRRRPWWVQPC